MPESFNQVLLLLVFIIPGSILIRIRRLAFPTAEESASRVALDSLALSCLVHGLCSPLWYWAYASKSYDSNPILFGTQLFLILFAVPVLLGASFNYFSRKEQARWLREFLGAHHPDPTAWDHHFRKGKAYWVWLTFKSGQVMAGLYGPKSFASSYPHKQDLYVEKLLLLDSHGKVQGWDENSAGAIVDKADLERIEFFDLERITT